MLVNFLFIASLFVNVASYYVQKKINDRLFKQSIALDKYKKRTTVLKQQLLARSLRRLKSNTLQEYSNE